jgi:hypothetical protein
MSYEYKCVGAPERPKRQRGVRGRSDRVALAMQEIIAGEAVDGWEYMRTDLVPVEEKAGLFSRTHEVHRAVLVFRRELEPEPRFVHARAHAVAAREAPAEPGRLTEPDREPTTEPRIRLSAERDEPPPLPRGNRPPPTGLG